MKKIFIMLAMFVLVVSGCTKAAEPNVQGAAETDNDAVQAEESADAGLSEIEQTFADWVLGTEYGIDEINIDAEGGSIEIVTSDENYGKLEDYEFADIKAGIDDILASYGFEENFLLMFSNGKILDSNIAKSSETENTDEEEPEETVRAKNEEGTVNLIFIHHSVGENWLNAGLNGMLNANGFHVADTYYGWREMGDRTDTADWPDWFNDDVMPQVYNELGNMTGYNSIEAAPGENTIIMFKSCYPNSDVGNSIEDEKEIYLGLLDYFSKHTDKMFVLITPPPMQHISHPAKTRELADWLVAEDGWRKDYAGGNLFVFDFYNVLTAEGNHHMLSDGAETHIINTSSDTLYYDSGGDDHPNDEGSLKAAEEFVPLLVYWYGQFSK